MIILKTRGGLCNRMRAISSAFFLAKKTQQRLLVEWSITSELNCSFFELFSKTADFTVERRITQNWNYRRNKVLTILGLQRRQVVANEEIYSKRKDGWVQTDFVNYFQEILQRKTLIIETDWNFYPSARDNFSMFKPTSELEKEIEMITHNFEDNFFGVHIRRGDHQVAIEESPDELFFAAIQEQMIVDPSAKFFLSTDSLATQRLLVSRFPDACLTYSIEKKRESSVGVKQALVDLYCLASTSRVIGSYWSSFSETASEINHIPLQIIKRTL